MDGHVQFDGDVLDDFWRFVHERQAVWYRRVVRGEAPPWTDDGVLRRYRFTNVYRLLDPGTQYAVREILERDAPGPDRLFNLLVYRLVGRSATHEHVGFLGLDGFDPDVFERTLRGRRDEGEVPVFTGAYVVAGYAGMGGDDKVANVARLFGRVRDRFDGFYRDLTGASELRAAYAAIRDLPGFGNFLAYQVLVDLLYPLDRQGGGPFLPFSPDEWAAAGPGGEARARLAPRRGGGPRRTRRDAVAVAGPGGGARPARLSLAPRPVGPAGRALARRRLELSL